MSIPFSIGLLILRVGTGVFLFTHGLGKVEMISNGTDFGDPIGLGSTLSLFLVTFAELICSLLVAVGLATRLAAIPPVIAMSVAAFIVHASNPWTMQEGATLFFSQQAETFASKEPALLFLFPFLALAFTGPGRYSLDHLIQSRRIHSMAIEPPEPEDTPE